VRTTRTARTGEWARHYRCAYPFPAKRGEKGAGFCVMEKPPIEGTNPERMGGAEGASSRRGTANAPKNSAAEFSASIAHGA